MADLVLVEKPKTVSLVNSKLPVDGVIGGLDLAAYQGSRPRKVWIIRERDGSISIDPVKGYWLEQEIDIPARQVVSQPVLDEKTAKPLLDDDGQPTVELRAVPIESVTVKTWAR